MHLENGSFHNKKKSNVCDSQNNLISHCFFVIKRLLPSRKPTALQILIEDFSVMIWEPLEFYTLNVKFPKSLQ